MKETENRWMTLASREKRKGTQHYPSQELVGKVTGQVRRRRRVETARPPALLGFYSMDNEVSLKVCS